MAATVTKSYSTCTSSKRSFTDKDSCGMVRIRPSYQGSLLLQMYSSPPDTCATRQTEFFREKRENMLFEGSLERNLPL